MCVIMCLYVHAQNKKLLRRAGQLIELHFSRSIISITFPVKSLPHVESRDPAPLRYSADMSSMESLNTQTTEQQEQLVSKKNAVFVVWTHFGFGKDDIEQNEVRCRHCRKTVSTPKGNTTNLFQHL